jgi:hypothetical protein
MTAPAGKQERIAALRERVKRLPIAERSPEMRAKRNAHRWGYHGSNGYGPVPGCPDCELAKFDAGVPS